MKKIKLLTLAIVCGGLLLQSCKEDKLDTFDSKDSIVFTSMMYFNTKYFTTSYTFGDETYSKTFPDYTERKSIDSLVVSSFLSTIEDEMRVYIPVTVVGAAKPVARPIAFKINYLTETGEAFNAIKGWDYKVVAAEVPANEIYGAILVEFYRTSMDIVYRPKVQMEVQLLENDNFATQMQEVKQSTTTSYRSNPTKLTVTCALGRDKPGGWDKTFGATVAAGYFSSKKFSVLLDLGFTEEFLSPGVGEARDVGQAQGLGTTLERYLNEMHLKGQTVYEDILDKNGNKVRMHRGDSMF